MQGHLVAVVGPVGSGKSSLLAAVLGEIDPSNSDSRVYRPERLSYACQKAFIQTMTIRDNILMNHPYDEARYNKVLDVCELRPDLAIFPAADLTEIGDRGVNLSGGQKQRVAIARAVYASHDLLLFDDPLSAVDASVGEKIFENCVSTFCAGKTRILVTNQLQYLPRVDHIVVMDHGRIAEQGTYDELFAKSRTFKELMEQHIGELGGSQSQDKAPVAAAAAIASAEQAPILDKKGAEKTAALDAGKTITDEELRSGDEGKANFWVHYRYMGGLPFWLPFCLLYALSQVGSTGCTFVISWWTTDNFKWTHQQYLGLYLAGGIFGTIMLALANVMFVYRSVAVNAKYHKDLALAVVRATNQFYDSTPTGRIINRFSQDIGAVDVELVRNIRASFNIAFTLLGSLVSTAIVTPPFAAPLIIMVLAFYLVQAYYKRAAAQLKRIESVARSPVFNHFSETLNGARPFVRTCA